MSKEERLEKNQQLIYRIRRIQNGTKNIGWGVSEYCPLMNLQKTSKTDSQYVIVVGHNVHRKIHTLFLECFSDETFSLSVMTKHNTVGEYLADCVSEEGIIVALCEALKTWFPEIARRD